MGFNIAGLVISQNYDRNIQKLEDDINWDIEIIEEITFDEASKNWTPEGEFRLYFTDKATMIFFPHEWVAERYYSAQVSSLCYAYSATAMTFFISYTDMENETGRFIISNNGETVLAEGTEMAYEKEGMSADGIIFKLFDDLLGENFHGLDFSDKAFRCKKLNFATTRLKYQKQKEERESAKLKEESTNKVKNEQVKVDASKTSNATKKWWEFWK